MAGSVSDHDPVLKEAFEQASRFLAGLRQRPAWAQASREELRAALGGALPEEGGDPRRVIEDLARAADPGLVASAGPRYFGFVVGGSLPAAVAADWLTSAWDQNAGLYVLGPAAAVVEEVAAGWLLDLLGLPKGCSVGFVTGCQMANYTGLIAARHAVLERTGWNVEEAGLAGAPAVRMVVGAQAHVTIFTAFRMLGLGSRDVIRVEADGQGRMRPDALRKVLAAGDGPVIVCAQAGDVNTGAFDPFEEIVDVLRGRNAWLHVDGAFGLWAGACPERRDLLKGVDGADSWATDAHKWLNVPYDSGIAIVKDPAAHRAPFAASASYLVQTRGAERDPQDYTPEFSRRARGFTVYAALRSLGRRGIADLVLRLCLRAQRLAERLGRQPGIRILNEVVLNQVLVRFQPPGVADPDAFTKTVIARVQRDGTCWLGGTRWRDQQAMRVSVSNWSTSDEDIDRSADAILAAVKTENDQA
jgi:glutamate/tyrosine decarboxylase-like PLP-dependent enzyme